MSKIYNTTTSNNTIRTESQGAYFKRLLVALIRHYGENGQSLSLPVSFVDAVKDEEGIEVSEFFDINDSFNEECLELTITNSWKAGTDDDGIVNEVNLDDDLEFELCDITECLKVVK